MISLSNVIKYENVLLQTPCEPPARLSLPAKTAAAVKPDVGSVKAQRDAILKSALIEAGKVLKNAKTEAQAIYRDAMRQGIDKGFREGYSNGEKQAVENEKIHVEQLKALCRRLEEEQAGQIERLNRESVDIAIKLASKILGMELDRNDEAFINLYKNAALRLGETSEATLKVGPRGYEIACRYEKELRKCISGLEKLDIELIEGGDGTCIIETPVGNVDASVEVQLHRAAELAGV